MSSILVNTAMQSLSPHGLLSQWYASQSGAIPQAVVLQMIT